jgi:hypothetical protein
MIAAAPRSNIRSIVHSATCEPSDSSSRLAIRYGRVRSASLPNTATAVNPMNCAPTVENVPIFLVGPSSTAQRHDRIQ